MPDYPGKEKRPGYRLIFRGSVTTKKGVKILASTYGKRGFPIWVPAGPTPISG